MGAPAATRYINLRNLFTGKRHRIQPYEGEGIFLCRQGASQIFFCRLRRHNLYKKGLAQRIDLLERQYNLAAASLTGPGLFIDCGANIGEMGLWARRRGLDYVAFEPEPLEAKCCDLNNFDGRPSTRRQALWKERATLEFYSKPDSADSSVFEIRGSIAVNPVEAVPLDEAIDLSKVAGSVIFKVEAEGAEPEVLQGAIKSLARIDYVAVDSGYERGYQKAHTFIETNNLLLQHGFELVAAHFKRVTALYRNTNR